MCIQVDNSYLHGYLFYLNQLNIYFPVLERNSVLLHTDAECGAKTAIGCTNNKNFCLYELSSFIIEQTTNRSPFQQQQFWTAM